MADPIKRVGVRELEVRLHGGDEVALCDFREEGVLTYWPLRMASCVSAGRLECSSMIWSRAGACGRVVRRRRRPRAAWSRAHERAALPGRGNARRRPCRRGGAGYRVDSGVHVPSKVFAEVGEHEARARPRDCAGIEALIDTGNRLPLLRRQSWERVARSIGPNGSPTTPLGPFGRRFDIWYYDLARWRRASR